MPHEAEAGNASEQPARNNLTDGNEGTAEDRSGAHIKNHSYDHA